MKKVLICGATGFIGRNVAESLAAQEEFEIYGTYLNSSPWEHPNVQMVCADLSHFADVQQVVKGMDIIIQAAATTSGAKDIVNQPYHHVTNNAVMNSLLLRAAYDCAVSHFVFFSCSVMYQSGETPVKESDFDANQPLHPSYFGAGWTKVYIERMCEFYARLGRTKHTVIRHSNIYGPHDKFDLEKSHVFGATMTKVMTAQDEKITIWGTGEEKRDLLYISDLVRFIELALLQQQEDYQLYNVGYGKAISINELVKTIIQSAGKSLMVEHDLSQPTIKTSLCLDCTKATQQLGWTPQISFEQGVQKTMAWYQKNLMTS